MTNSNQQLISQELIQQAQGLCKKVIDQLDLILLGQHELHELVITGILSQGHILLEGLPGLGKTALVKALGEILNLDFKRVQFTPDLMPGDILGSHILQETETGEREMIFRPGPVFTNILLADEINRASAKTQSAMLETMQERSVTLLGTTRKLPSPFFVLASQNPIELEGTYPLPEAQIDRFLFRLLVTQVNAEILSNIIYERRRGEVPTPSWKMQKEELDFLFDIMNKIYLSKPIADYIARLVEATHPTAKNPLEIVKNYVAYGASPRAAIAIAEAARATAIIAGRPTVGFEDVVRVAPAVLNHRLNLNYKAHFDHFDATQIINKILLELPKVDLGMPSDVTLKY